MGLALGFKLEAWKIKGTEFEVFGLRDRHTERAKEREKCVLLLTTGDLCGKQTAKEL